MSVSLMAKDHMTDRVRIIKHEAVPDCGSYEVKIPGKPSQYFYWEDNPGRRLRPEQVDQETAKRQAQEFARSINPPPNSR